MKKIKKNRVNPPPAPPMSPEQAKQALATLQECVEEVSRIFVDRGETAEIAMATTLIVAAQTAKMCGLSKKRFLDEAASTWNNISMRKEGGAA